MSCVPDGTVLCVSQLAVFAVGGAHSLATVAVGRGDKDPKGDVRRIHTSKCDVHLDADMKVVCSQSKSLGKTQNSPFKNEMHGLYS